jgi:hypothetical protein
MDKVLLSIDLLGSIVEYLGAKDEQEQGQCGEP